MNLNSLTRRWRWSFLRPVALLAMSFMSLGLVLSSHKVAAQTSAVQSSAAQAIAVQAREAAKSEPASAPLLVGLGEADITPPEGFPMAGYYHERLATGQRDPLKAKAVVFRSGEKVGAWVVCDLTGVSRDLCLEIRKRVSQKTRIPESQIVVSATHSHTAPDYSRDLYDYLAGRSPAAGRPSYAPKLIDGAVNAIVRAHAAAKPASLSAGAAIQETPVSFNRRFVMQDGSVRTWQRLDTPGVVRAAGPIDPEIGLLAINAADDAKPLGLLSSFALHLDTVGGLQWSGDYPFFIEQSLRGKFGEPFISVFGTGTCGDINHSDPVRKERNTTDVIGRSIAKSIDGALPGLRPAGFKGGLQVRTEVVKLPLQDVTDAELKRACELIPASRAGQKIDFFDQVSAYKAVVLDHLRNKPSKVVSTDYINWGLSHSWAGVGESLPVEVTTMTIGQDVALVFLPGEIFVDLGLAIKRSSPFRTTLVVELSNCVETIYIPTRAAYASGSYEVTNSNVQPGSGEMLVESAIRQLRLSAQEAVK